MAAPEHITDPEIEALGLKIVDEVKSATVREGDTLIVSLDRQINMEEYRHLVEFCEIYIPMVKVLVLPEVKDIRVFRPGEPEGM